MGRYVQSPSDGIKDLIDRSSELIRVICVTQVVRCWRAADDKRHQEKWVFWCVGRRRACGGGHPQRLRAR
jgi:hypothetical protein